MVNLPLLALALWAGVLHAGREDLWVDAWRQCVPEAGPLLTDLDRFPDEKATDEALSFIWARTGWLDRLEAIYPDAYYRAWFAEAREDLDVRHSAWNRLEEAQRWRRYGRTDQRAKYGGQSLAQLREMLGERDYNAGVMPGLIGADFMGGR